MITLTIAEYCLVVALGAMVGVLGTGIVQLSRNRGPIGPRFRRRHRR